MSAGERLAEELARDGDPITIRELIGHAAQFADLIERCDDLISGKKAAWMQVRLSSDQVVEVRIGDVVRERRQLTTELRHLLAEEDFTGAPKTQKRLEDFEQLFSSLDSVVQLLLAHGKAGSRILQILLKVLPKAK